MIRILVLATFAAAVSLANSHAIACSCPPAPPPKKSLALAAAVFSGKVVAIDIDKANYTKTVTIAVSQFWKGDIGKTVRVSTALHGATCGYAFKKGGDYLVYCYASQAKHSEPVILRTNICTRTRPMEKATADIKEIGVGKKPGEK